ncbi:MAG: AI-2E family transporter [Acidimicrobiia bacterium]
MAASTRHGGRRPEPPLLLRLTPGSVLRAVAMFGLTLLLLAVVGASGRVIGWILTAATLAGLFHPVVVALDRFLPRALALVVVLVSTLAVVGGLAYAVVDEVADQVGELEQALPEAARDVERSDRFGETARDLRLAERAQQFVDELPERLRGGSVNDAIRSAATRGVAFLVTTVLTIFFLVHGPRLVEAALRQLPAEREPAVRAGAASAYRRTWTYVSGSLGMAIAAGAIAYLCADLLGLPGKAALALFVALFDLIPLIGLVLGSLPIVLLAATTATWEATVAVTLVLIGWQLVEGLQIQRDVERRSLHVGPYVTLIGAFLGLELYGIGGVFAALIGSAAFAAVLDEAFGHGPRSASPEPEAPSPGPGPSGAASVGSGAVPATAATAADGPARP